MEPGARNLRTGQTKALVTKHNLLRYMIQHRPNRINHAENIRWRLGY
jgi:hypothetical protein